MMGVLRKRFEPRNPATFHGWAARIIAWPEGKRPELVFGTWDAKKLTVTLEEVEPDAVILYGANGKKMTPKEKFTMFGRIGCEDDGSLRLTRMYPEEGDARDRWLHPPDPRQEIPLATAALAALDPAGGKAAALEALELVHRGLNALGLLTPARIDQDGGHVAAIPELLDRLSRLEMVFPQLWELHQTARTFFQAWERVRQERKAARSMAQQAT